jgi:hypothetical protein
VGVGHVVGLRHAALSAARPATSPGVLPLTALVRLLLLLAFLMAGCVSLTPAQQAGLDDWTEFANRVTTAYGKPAVRLIPNDSGGGVAGLMYPDGRMMVRPDRISRGNDFLLAHELGHYVTGFFGCGVSCELAANAEAVKVLMIGRGMTEAQAVGVVYTYLWRYKRRADAKLTMVPAGHPDPCVEILDIARRYPQYPSPAYTGCTPELRGWPATAPGGRP